MADIFMTFMTNKTFMAHETSSSAGAEIAERKYQQNNQTVSRQ